MAEKRIWTKEDECKSIIKDSKSGIARGITIGYNLLSRKDIENAEAFLVGAQGYYIGLKEGSEKLGITIGLEYTYSIEGLEQAIKSEKEYEELRKSFREFIASGYKTKSNHPNKNIPIGNARLFHRYTKETGGYDRHPEDKIEDLKALNDLEKYFGMEDRTQ